MARFNGEERRSGGEPKAALPKNAGGHLEIIDRLTKLVSIRPRYRRGRRLGKEEDEEEAAIDIGRFSAISRTLGTFS